jgi:hypothetical protein
MRATLARVHTGLSVADRPARRRTQDGWTGGFWLAAGFGRPELFATQLGGHLERRLLVTFSDPATGAGGDPAVRLIINPDASSSRRRARQLEGHPSHPPEARSRNTAVCWR